MGPSESVLRYYDGFTDSSVGLSKRNNREALYLQKDAMKKLILGIVVVFIFTVEVSTTEKRIAPVIGNAEGPMAVGVWECTPGKVRLCNTRKKD